MVRGWMVPDEMEEGKVKCQYI
jgi:hypothetical protein